MPSSISISSIHYDDSLRQRQELDPEGVEELAKSIAHIGLLNPIILDRTNKLLAGRRRLEACKLLKKVEIEFRYFEDLDPVEQAVVEFDENHKRRQLSWQEECDAIARIHRMQNAKLDFLKVKSGPFGGEHWSAQDTADLLGIGQAKVAEDLQLHRVLGDERVAKRPSRRGALTTMRRVRELELVQEIARRRALEMGIDIESSTLAGGRLYNDDCREVLGKMAPESVDLVVTDPPWGVNFDQAAQWAKKFVKTYDDDQLSVMRMLVEVFPLLFKVMRPASHLYSFFPIQDLQWWTDELIRVGFYTRARPIIWFKSGSHAMTDLYTEFRPTYEAMIFAWKPGNGGIKRLFNVPIDDGYAFPRQPTEFHENEKPVEMIKHYIEASSNINEVVLDPFSGGGSILAAAYEIGRYFVGVEKDEIHFAKSERRLKNLEDANVTDDKES